MLNEYNYFFFKFIKLTNLFSNLFKYIDMDDSYKINYKYFYISIRIMMCIHNFVKVLMGTTCIN